MNSQTTSGIRILLAESDDALYVAARHALERLGYQVTVARDGAEALARFADGQFDLVLAGMSLPQRDGLEVLRGIKAERPETEVILLTDNTTIGSAALGLREGAFTYLLKPIEDLRQLTHTVERAIELQQLRQHARASSSETATALEGAATTPFSSTRDRQWRMSALPRKWRQVPLHFASTSMLRKTIEATRSGKPVGDTLQLVLESAVHLFNAAHAVVLLAHEKSGLQFNSAYGYADAGDAALGFAKSVGDAFAWRVATSRTTLIESTSEPETKADLIHFIGTPLLFKDRVLGVAVAYPLPSKRVDPERVAWFESFAAQGALAIEQARLIAENESLSPNDPLTGALKRIIFLDLADHEFRRSWRYNQPITSIIVDVDDMTIINLKSGRTFGDRVLCEVANACRLAVRSIDLVARYEEDSFTLLLLMTGPEGARSAAERIRTAIGAIDLTDAYRRVRISASLGVCTYPRSECASIFDLLNITHGAQRAARQTGSNGVSFA